MKHHFKDTSHPWVNSLNFQDISAAELRFRVAAARANRTPSGAPPVWVFDLDSTLFCVSTRIRAIFLEFLRHHPAPLRMAHFVYERLHPGKQQYSIERSFQEILRDWDAARAQELGTQLWHEFESFWSQRFFSSRFMHWDQPYTEAPEFVRQVMRDGFEVVYLTGRDYARNIQGTREALRHGGFPLGEQTHLMLKPTKEEPDVAFKARACSVLRSRFDVAVFIDNEPENLVAAARELPQAEIVLFHSVMSDRIPQEDYLKHLGPQRVPLRLLNYSLGQQ
ncbi:MAG: HAD family hydrolase [Bdellovibrionales bacterium]|nr:HAD family hydrolase [Bdellovibrionales bacterium]